MPQTSRSSKICTGHLLCRVVFERLLVSNGLGAQASRGIIDQLKLHGNSKNGQLANHSCVALLVLPKSLEIQPMMRNHGTMQLRTKCITQHN